jgi:hypothetical protein
MEKYVISKLKKNNYLFLIICFVRWKLTLGYGSSFYS